MLRYFNREYNLNTEQKFKLNKEWNSYIGREQNLNKDQKLFLNREPN